MAEASMAPQSQTESQSGAISLNLPRAFIWGSLMSLAIGVGVPYGTLILRGSYMDLDFSTPGAIFLLFIVTALLNPAIRLLAKRLALTSHELIVAYTMTLLACSIPTMGMTCQLLPIISGFRYYASPENHWEDTILPHIPQWMYPASETGIKYFYEALPPGQLLPWMIWLKPLALWLLFIFAFQLVSICLMVIYRRQWIENERLVYPLAQLPMEMIGTERTAPGRGLYRSPALWVGFAIPFIIGAFIGLHKYVPAIPAPTLNLGISAFRKSQSLQLRLSFPMIGFFYLVEQQTTFSLWFFNLLFFVVRGFLNILHIGMTENLGIYGARSPVFAHLGVGAFIAMILVGLKVGRLHFSAVIRKAMAHDAGVKDGDEIMSYREAVWGLLIGLVIMLVWIVFSGMQLLLAIPFLLIALLLFVGLTRIVAESGMAEAVAPSIAPGVMVSALGSQIFGPAGLSAMGMSYVWLSDMRVFVMATAAHGLKLGQSLPAQRRRPLLWAMAGGILIAAAVSIPLTLYWAYRNGGPTLNDWFWTGAPMAAAKWSVDKIVKPTAPSVPGWIMTGVGAGLMLWLSVMRQQVMWWPFHPIGFALGGVWMMDELWATILGTWLIKAVIMRYGGVKAFQSARPFFLGLILGQFSTNAIWLILDRLTGHTGNMIFWI
jgi:hypothetical protein